MNLSVKNNRYRVMETIGGWIKLVDPQGRFCGKFINRDLAQKTANFMNHAGPMAAQSCGEGFSAQQCAGSMNEAELAAAS